MFPYAERARLEILDAHTFRSWVESFLVCYKTKIDNAGDSYDVLRTMNRDTAEAVLKCNEFWQGLHEVVTFNPVRLPVVSSMGQSRLLEPGYDEDTRTLTFEG
ncbi:MAG TPA: hypothetical protein VJU77_16705 [Chthoniobacterales bacterium]|nr:hypothetical protein [Chthoniobacterales bacterium]